MRGSVTQILLRVVFFIVFSWSGDSTKNLIITGMKLVHLSSVSFQVSTFNYHIVVDNKVLRLLQQVRLSVAYKSTPLGLTPSDFVLTMGQRRNVGQKAKVSLFEKKLEAKKNLQAMQRWLDFCFASK